MITASMIRKPACALSITREPVMVAQLGSPGVTTPLVTFGRTAGPSTAWGIAIMCLVLIIRICLLPLFLLPNARDAAYAGAPTADPTYPTQVRRA